jgi:hypothetical protein
LLIAAILVVAMMSIASAQQRFDSPAEAAGALVVPSGMASVDC